VVTLLPSPYQVELFDALAAAGVNCHVIYLQTTEPGRSWRLPPLRHDHSLLPQGWAAAEQCIRQADLVIFGGYQAPVVQHWLAACRRAGRRMVLWGERPGFRRRGWLGRLGRAWRLRHFRRARGIVWGIGSWAVAGWQAELGPRHTYVNVPYFSDLQRFAEAARNRTPSATRRILFSGALIPRKGVDLLAQAFAQVAPSRPHLRLDILGAGELESWLRQRLQALAGQVRFLGFRDWPELPTAYADADILCVPSRYDGWGLVVPEGLAAGLPVIATDQMGAALDLIRPGENGWRLPAGDAGALAAKLAEVADMPAAAWDRLSAAAQASVAHHQLSDGVQRWRAAALAAAQA
jgi:glycosyltransferase involved in cell wall biosynthesis